MCRAGVRRGAGTAREASGLMEGTGRPPSAPAAGEEEELLNTVPGFS